MLRGPLRGRHVRPDHAGMRPRRYELHGRLHVLQQRLQRRPVRRPRLPPPPQRWPVHRLRGAELLPAARSLCSRRDVPGGRAVRLCLLHRRRLRDGMRGEVLRNVPLHRERSAGAVRGGDVHGVSMTVAGRVCEAVWPFAERERREKEGLAARERGPRAIRRVRDPGERLGLRSRCVGETRGGVRLRARRIRPDASRRPRDPPLAAPGPLGSPPAPVLSNRP
jgi:hypothetical protein